MSNIQPLELAYILRKAKEESVKAVDDFKKSWRQKTGGNQYDEPMYCGFAWVSIHGVKGSTKLGKAFKEHGFKKVIQVDCKCGILQSIMDNLWKLKKQVQKHTQKYCKVLDLMQHLTVEQINYDKN